jgi:hypothetical protein
VQTVLTRNATLRELYDKLKAVTANVN